MSAVWSVIIAFVFGIIGAVLLIVPKSNFGAIGISHHILVLIGVLALIVASAAVYNILTCTICKPKAKAVAPKATVKKPAKKTAKSSKKAKKKAKKSAKKSSKKKRK